MISLDTELANLKHGVTLLSQTVSPLATGAPYDEYARLRRQWWLFFALGLASVIVGLLAISFAFIATMVKVVVFGVLLLIAGIVEAVHAIMVRNLKGFALHLLAAALYLIVGLFMLEDPVQAAVVLTLLLAACLSWAACSASFFRSSTGFQAGRGSWSTGWSISCSAFSSGTDGPIRACGSLAFSSASTCSSTAGLGYFLR
jgi:uncharacterized membrane protein HdeD (DUF308 family)